MALKLINMNDQKKEKKWWNLQKDGKWKDLVAPLKANSEIHSQLDNLIKTAYWNFREKKRIDKNYKPLIVFQGFAGFADFPLEGKMGHCKNEIEEKIAWKEVDGEKVVGSEKTEIVEIIINIELSQKLLLSKLGMDWLVSDYQEGVKWGGFRVDFDQLIGTIAHELAHAFQFTKNDDKVKSQCESTGDRDENGNLVYPQLAAEHTQLTSEIKSMITNSLEEYQEFKNWWNGRENEPNLLKKTNENKINQDEKKGKCSKCGKEQLESELTIIGVKEGNKTNTPNEGDEFFEEKYCHSCLTRFMSRKNNKVDVFSLDNHSEINNPPDPNYNNLLIGLGIGGIIILIGISAYFLTRKNKKN